MRRLRLLLLPLGAAAELSVLAACWVLALLGHTRAATRLHDWAVGTLPTVDWYMGEG